MSEIANMVYDDLNKMKLLCDDLKKDLIKAAIATVNIKAALARKEAINNIKNNFTLRNNFTTSQIQFTPAPEGHFSISDIHSTIGVTQKAAYMARQEEGGEHTPSQGKTLAIPTNVARGGSIKSAVLSSMHVKNLGKKRVIGNSNREYNSHKAFIAARAFIAFKEGLFLPLGGSGDRSNLHEVISFQSTGDKIEFKTRQVYKFEQEKTITPSQPWLLPACEKVDADSQQIFNSQAKKVGL